MLAKVGNDLSIRSVQMIRIQGQKFVVIAKITSYFYKKMFFSFVPWKPHQNWFAKTRTVLLFKCNPLSFHSIHLISKTWLQPFFAATFCISIVFFEFSTKPRILFTNFRFWSHNNFTVCTPFFARILPFTRSIIAIRFSWFLNGQNIRFVQYMLSL